MTLRRFLLLSTIVIAHAMSACGGGGGSGGDSTPPVIRSSDAGLANLTVSTGDLDQAFGTGTNSYTHSTHASSLNVTPTLSDSNASVTVNGSNVASGAASSAVDLTLGSNTITTVVTAENGTTTRTYTISVTRLNVVAGLSDLSFSTGALDPAFSSTIYSYDQTTDAASLTVMPILSDANASVTVNGSNVASGSASASIVLAVGSNVIAIVVTAQDGTTTQDYIVTVSRLDNNADLAFLVLSDGNLDQIFQPTLFDYTATLDFLLTSVQVSATAGSPAASLTINGGSVNSGDASQPIPLELGSNTVSIDVIAEDGVSVKTYTVVINRQSANFFAQQAYIKASNTRQADGFGTTLALSGDTLAVGAPGEDSGATGVNGDQADNSASDSGAVYLFTRDVAGIWSQQAYIKASNTGAGDGFGYSVALSGDTLAVGASDEDSQSNVIDAGQSDNSYSDSGAAYVFTRTGTTWSQQAYIKPFNTFPGSLFGWSVDLSADSLAVGAQAHDTAAGAAYIFTRTGTAWSQQAYIKASNADDLDRFGHSIAIFGDTLAVGAIREDSAAAGIDGDQNDNNQIDSGAAYIFVRDGIGNWNQYAYVKPSEYVFNFGKSVALSTATLAVGSGAGAGHVYIFTRDGIGNWSEQASIGGFGGAFGWSVALSGENLAVGAYQENSSATGVNGDQADNSAGNSGAAYVFARVGTEWIEQAYVKASNTEGDDWFGLSVALSDIDLVIGAPQEDSASTGIGGEQADNSAVNSGAVYVIQ